MHFFIKNQPYLPSTLFETFSLKNRYNSVSYHVTIYHRNPPIVCDEPGCNFRTREARYIHFHKFYRHNTPLPNNIDLDARRCPHCKHVAKSPAMLDKHMRRHNLTPPTLQPQHQLEIYEQVGQIKTLADLLWV